jgi:hypothetical protein
MWATLRGRAPDYGAFGEEWPPGNGPQEDDALVALGPPRRPRPSSAVALPLPDVEPEDAEAVAREFDDDESGRDG